MQEGKERIEMPFESIQFEAPDEMLIIAQPLFDAMHKSAKDKDGKAGMVIFQILENGTAGGCFIPPKGAKKIIEIIRSYIKKPQSKKNP